MIINAMTVTGTAQLQVDSGSLVWDGTSFVDPTEATYVMLVTVVPTLISPNIYPVTVQAPIPSGLTVTGTYLCVVTSIDPAITSGNTVVAVADPLNGQCLCGITCTGTQIATPAVTIIES
jgi:hypothetical protein